MSYKKVRRVKMKMFEKKLPDAELEIMKIIWHEKEPLSTGEIKALTDSKTENAWTQQTVQSLINRLISKKFLAKDKRGREYIYTPLIEEKDYIEYESAEFLKKMHGNSVTNLMRALFDTRKISDKDIAELEKMFRQKGNGGND